MLYAVCAFLALIADQALKLLCADKLIENDITSFKTLIPGVIHLCNVRNDGSAIANNRILLIAILLIFTAAVVFVMVKGIVKTRFGRITLALVLAGALGNGLDHAVFGYVVDVLEFEFFDFAIFNLADCLIAICGILFCVHVILYKGFHIGADEEKTQAERPVRRARREEEENAFYSLAPAQRPAAPAQRPAAPAQRPAAPAQRPAAPAQRSAVPAQRPAAPAQRSAAPAQRPAAPAQRPAVPAQRPAVPAQRPAAPAQRSAVPAQRPAAPAQRPAAPAQRPAAPAQRPAAPAVKEPIAPATASDEFDLDSILAEFQ